MAQVQTCLFSSSFFFPYVCAKVYSAKYPWFPARGSRWYIPTLDSYLEVGNLFQVKLGTLEESWFYLYLKHGVFCLLTEVWVWISLLHTVCFHDDATGGLWHRGFPPKTRGCSSKGAGEGRAEESLELSAGASLLTIITEGGSFISSTAIGHSLSSYNRFCMWNPIHQATEDVLCDLPAWYSRGFFWSVQTFKSKITLTLN